MGGGGNGECLLLLFYRSHFYKIPADYCRRPRNVVNVGVRIAYLSLNRCFATIGCMAARPRLTAAPPPRQLHTDNRWSGQPSGHITAVVFQMHAGDN